MIVESNWNRRKFLQSGFLLSTGGLLPLNCWSFADKRAKKLTILHTNDTHSHIEPFAENHPKYPNVGGVIARAQKIQEIRDQEENVLLLDAGDIFQGTPYFNKYKGVLEMQLMSKMKYDCATMGNHDFDGGMEGFLNAKKRGDFPFVCSNYDFSNTLLDSQTFENVIIEKDNLRIGIFGLGVELDGLVPKTLYKETKYLDPIEMAELQVRKLQQKKCDLIICLSHLGYSYQNQKISDLLLAEKTEGIHLIIGGHTHTFLKAPTQVTNKAGQMVLVNQVGWAGINLGRIDFYFEKSKSKPNFGGSSNEKI